MVKKPVILLIIWMITRSSLAQTGGDNVYEFLNLTHSGLISALGGYNVSLFGSNINTAYNNPGLLNKSMNNSAAFNYVNYFAGINYGMAMYARSNDNMGIFAAGITYLNYGSFTAADNSGNITGSFRASEYAFNLLYSRSIDSSITIGINLKPVLSHLEDYTSAGIAADIGVSWQSRNKFTAAGLVFRNIGRQLTTYAGEDREQLPFEIQAGITQRLPHAPFRFSLTYRHLEKFDLTHQYAPPGGNSTAIVTKSDFSENLLRHLITGVELIPHKNFWICAGYNYQRRSELKVDSKVSSVGFSWGFGINTSWADIEFGRATYHLAGSSSHISLIIRPGKIYRKININ